MKQGYFILNVILIVAVIVLFFLHFAQKKQPSVNDQKKVMVNRNNDTVAVPIVFVNLDTLLFKYQYSKDLNDKFLKKKERVKEDLNSRLDAFEKEAMAFQDKIKRGSFISQESAESQQAELIEKRQNLEQLQSELTSQLMDEQEKLNHQLYETIVNFLKEYNKQHRYQYILSSSYGGDMLLGDEQLDITGTIIELMNQRYNEQKN
jgi:outer membrane protein